MNVVELNRIVVPVAILFFFALCMVWPTLRTWRRTGVWPVTFRRVTDPTEQVVGKGMAVAFLAVALWAPAVALGSPQALGIWRVPTPVILAGWAAMAGGLLIMVVAQAQMGASWRIGIDEAPTPLVTGGLFRLVRNPIFSSMLLTVFALVLATPSAWTVCGAIYATTLISLQTRLEERHLVRLHGEQYRQYAARVGRFLPGLGRLGAA